MHSMEERVSPHEGIALKRKEKPNMQQLKWGWKASLIKENFHKTFDTRRKMSCAGGREKPLLLQTLGGEMMLMEKGISILM